MKYYLDSLDQLNKDKVSQIIQSWRLEELPRLNKYQAYYDGLMEILNKSYSDPTKSCAKLVVNYCSSIVDSYAGYLAGIPISYSSEDDISDIMEILRYNDYHTEDVEFLTNALIFGIAFEINYVDSEAYQRFKVLDSRECIPIYQNNLEEELLAVIRMYSANDLDHTEATFVDVYTDNEIIRYYSSSGYTGYELKDIKKHYYKMVPISIFNLNKDNKSIFDRIMDLNDGYNDMLSSSIDDYNSFVDALLLIQGRYGELTDETVKRIREDRIIQLDPGSTAEWIVKNQSNSTVQSTLETIDKQICKISKCPDFTDESFGTSSGIAIRYKLISMETNAASIEANMKKALLRRLELISKIQKLKVGDIGWRDIEIIFQRNIPEDLTDVVNLVNSLRGLVSDRTLLGQIPFIRDVDKEMDLLEEQKQSEVSTVYEFNYEEEEA